MISHLLDSNACIDHLRHGKSSKVSHQLDAMPPGSVVLCSVVIAELVFGARRSVNPTSALKQVTHYCDPFDSIPFEDSAAEVYGLVKADLFAKGTPIGPNDLLIAAIAIANGLTLVTHNTSEFGRIAGLALEDWQ